MDQLEKQITDLPWRRPQKDLKERIFAGPALHAVKKRTTGPRFGLKWVAILMLGTGLAGYVVGSFQKEGPNVRHINSLDELPSSLVVVYSASGANLFEMTQRGSNILPDEYVVSCNMP